MLATVFRSRERWPNLFYPWLVVASVSTLLMWASPGNETIPYHIAWVAFAVSYGEGPAWSVRSTVVGITVFATATGWILIDRAADGVIAWQETAEIPLMTLLVLLMVWHVRRRQVALAEVTTMAQAELVRGRDRDRLTRLTSHELRTPITIAQGYVELLIAKSRARDRRDLLVVQDELSRLARGAERLLRVIRIQGTNELERVDVDRLVRDTGQRWSAVADRDWVFETRAGTWLCSSERLRSCLDTLIENALRYTTEVDTIRLFCVREDGSLRIGVADSGRGLSPDQLELMNSAPEPNGSRPGSDLLQASRDSLSQTGLGLGLVRSVAHARGGRVVAAGAPEGGALVCLVIPERMPKGLAVQSPGLVTAPPAGDYAGWTDQTMVATGSVPSGSASVPSGAVASHAD
jgi:signal transduction histidine kinase